jgi:hypothetical protein
VGEFFLERFFWGELVGDFFLGDLVGDFSLEEVEEEEEEEDVGDLVGDLVGIGSQLHMNLVWFPPKTGS